MSIGRDASVMDVMIKMVERRVTSFIVEKEDEQGVYGIVTRKDIINKVIAYGKDPREVKVHEVGSEPLMAISPDMSVETIARFMAKTNIRRFPVMVDGELVGMVSNSDILKAIALEHM